ncbi:MAG: hypothetical protein ACC707_15455 [Thiohalomonadales bacterium]
MNKSKGRNLLLAFLLFLPIFNGHAAVPLLVNYQGTVKDATGAAINADGYFKFAIVDQAGTVASWVNNGTLLNGSEPPNAVITPVTNGRFLIKLGDNTNLSNMEALTESVFANSPLYLRVWFSLSETGPYELFTPDTQIVSTGFAVKAANADRAVIADQVANIDATQIQSRVTDNCSGGDTISAINQDGTVVCEVDDGEVYSAGNGISIVSGAIAIAVGGVGNAQISDVAWGKLQGIPADIADGDNVGIIAETDPTVLASVKDGVSWTELTGIPAGFSDDIDNGITSESDPQVGTLTNGRWCTSNGTLVNCTSIAPTGLWSLNTSNVFYNSRNVAIGTSFQVNSAILPANARVLTISAASASQNKSPAIIQLRGSDTNDAAGTIGAIDFFNIANSSNYHIAKIEAVRRDFNPTYTAIKFHTRIGSILSSKMIITETGNVGIGTEFPVGKLDVNGTIYQRGGALHADYVFEPEYQLESIEEHSDYMWRERHLKAIPAASVDDNGLEVIEVGKHRKGIVEELEKAHIYIEQLNRIIKKLEERITNLENS